MSELKAFKIRVIGRVQRVGYRRHVLEEARKRKLTGYVKNEPDDSVTIFIQGSSEPIDAFVSVVKKPPPPALVREVEREEAGLSPEMEHFEMRYGPLGEELQEGFGAMQSVFQDYRNEFRDYRGEFRGFAGRTDGNFRDLGERYGEISEKLTLTLETLRAESSETRRMLRDAIESFKRDSGETREELRKSVEALVELVKGFTKRAGEEITK